MLRTFEDVYPALASKDDLVSPISSSDSAAYDVNQVISRASASRIWPPSAGASGTATPSGNPAVEDVFAGHDYQAAFEAAGQKATSRDALASVGDEAEAAFSPARRDARAASPPPIPPPRENSLRELTKRASEEDELRKKKAQTPAGLAAVRNRKDSLSKGKAAGLASPYESPLTEQFAVTPHSTSNPPFSSMTGAGIDRDKGRKGAAAPPVSGVTQTNRQRTRSSSTSSTGSINKDRLLEELSSALRLEKRRVVHYEEEILKCEEEIDTLNRALKAQQEQHTEEARKQDMTIKNLRAQLEELKVDLDAANDLEPEAAHEYLALLGKVDDTSRLESSPGLRAPNEQISKAIERAARRVNIQAVASELPRRSERDVPVRKLSRRKKPPSPGDLFESQLAAQMKQTQIDQEHKPSRAHDESRHPPVAGVTRPATMHKRSNSWKKIQATLRVVFPSSAERNKSNPFHQEIPPVSNATKSGEPSIEDLKQLLRAESGTTGYSNPFALASDSPGERQKAFPATAH